MSARTVICPCSLGSSRCAQLSIASELDAVILDWLPPLSSDVSPRPRCAHVTINEL